MGLFVEHTVLINVYVLISTYGRVKYLRRRIYGLHHSDAPFLYDAWRMAPLIAGGALSHMDTIIMQLGHVDGG